MLWITQEGSWGTDKMGGREDRKGRVRLFGRDRLFGEIELLRGFGGKLGSG